MKLIDKYILNFTFLCTFLPITLCAQQITVDGRTYSNIEEAEKSIRDHSKIYLTKGLYNRGLHIKNNGVVVSGEVGTHFKNAAIFNKAAFVISGNDVILENIECSEITVPNKNGSCVRQEGKNLLLNNVYFHNSEQGVLSSSNSGKLTIKYSHFEKLGRAGRAHGVYSNNEELIILHSKIINAVDQGHEVKTTAKITRIDYSIIGSISTDDSRAIDNSNGGTLVISNSVLFQGPNTVNGQLMSYGLEGMGRQRKHSLIIKNNIFILERDGTNVLLGLPKDNSQPIDIDIKDNVVIGLKELPDERFYRRNVVYANREEAQLLENTIPHIESLSVLRILKSL